MATTNRGGEFIEVDLGGDRFTHYPSGDTCLRHQWMRGNGRDAAAWVEKRDAFFAKHPDCHMLVGLRHGQAVVIGDVRDIPGRGREFKIGDRVVTLDRARDADCAREIAAVRPNGSPECRLPQDPPVCFLLEDGEVMYWSTSEDAWLSRNRDGSDTTRIRRPVDGEDLTGLELTAGEILHKAIPGMIGYLAEVRDAVHLWHGEWAKTSNVTRDEVQAVVEALSATRKGLSNDPADSAYRDAGAAAVARAGELAGRIAKSEGAAEAGLLSLHYDVGGVADRAEVIGATLARRGVSEPTAPVPGM